MKRYATLALAAIFALSFTANVAAAPEFSGEFTVENELALGGDAINVGGDGPDLTFTLGAGEEGIWSLEVDLGSALTDGATVVQAITLEEGVALVSEVAKFDGVTYYKDPAGNYYEKVGDEDEDPWKKVGATRKAQIAREVANNGEWKAIELEGDDKSVDIAAPGLELGAYKLTITPGPFTLVVAGNGSGPNSADLFKFIESEDEPEDPKFQLTTDVAGLGLTAEYETEGDDALYIFAKAPVAGVGEFGVALEAAEIATGETAMQFSADVKSDALGFATLKAGVAFDMDVEDDQDALAFAIGAEAPVIEGLVVDAEYKNEGRERREDDHTQTISVGAKYNVDMVTGSVAMSTRGEDDEAKLTLKAGVNYPVIADVFTVKAAFESITDEDSPLNKGTPTAYKWDDLAVGDILYGLLTIDASADYAVTDAFTVTPSIKYQSFTLQTDREDEDTKGEGTITTFGVSGTYKFSDAASITVGFENASADAVKGENDDQIVPEVETTKLTTAFTVSF